ncbi:MAG: hypothetical protein V4631_00785 [Pseudomonadota bacterium]
MVSEDLLQSWERTEKLLKIASSFLSPTVVKQQENALLEMAEFLEHNELGLAFDWLKSIAQECQWDSVELLEALVLAAENMGRIDDADRLRQRILELA